MYGGVWRMDWGFQNPNKTAAFIALLMLGVWGIAFIRRWGFWVALVPFTGLGVCLVHTFSRGGMIAFIGGLVALINFAPRPWPRSRLIALMLSVWLIVGASIYLDAYSRYGQGIAHEDRSITNRLKIWRKTPEMIADAPGGWGVGRAGDAYMQWYQALGEREQYRTLVNSHLTWLVEFNWWQRFLYIAGWLGVLRLCFPGEDSRRAVPFAVWITFLIGSFFSSVAESPWMWAIPVTCLAWVVVDRSRRQDWPRFGVWIGVFGTSGAVLLLILSWGLRSDSLKIRKSAHAITIGEGIPRIWVVIDPKIFGHFYGRTFRANLATLPIGFVSSVADIPQAMGQRIVIGGTLSPSSVGLLLLHAGCLERVSFVNPYFYPQNFDWKIWEKSDVIFGEFSQSPVIAEWSRNSSRNFTRLSGVGDFVPNWPTVLQKK